MEIIDIEKFILCTLERVCIYYFCESVIKV